MRRAGIPSMVTGSVRPSGVPEDEETVLGVLLAQVRPNACTSERRRLVGTEHLHFGVEFMVPPSACRRKRTG